jgi:hypothetical protein
MSENKFEVPVDPSALGALAAHIAMVAPGWIQSIPALG